MVEGPATASGPTREHWTGTVKDLMPLCTINRFTVHNGRLAYLDFTESPDVQLHIDYLQLTALNLANAENSANDEDVRHYH